MRTAFEVSYIAATVVGLVYVAILVRTLVRGGDYMPAGNLFAWAMGVALAGVVTGEMLADNGVRVTDLIVAAIPFGLAASALYAFAQRDRTPHREAKLLESVGLAVSVVIPFAAGVSGWSVPPVT